MKGISTILIGLLFNTIMMAQWTPVNNGLSNTSVTAMVAVFDTLYAATDGGGIFKSTDNGDSWTNINGNLGNLNVDNMFIYSNVVTLVFAATAGGPFSTTDGSNWTDNTGTGLANTDVTLYAPAELAANNDFTIGTNGGGVYVSDNADGPWTALNNGLSGDALIINNFGGYRDDDVDYFAIATNDGVYITMDDGANWIAKNAGFSGDDLIVNKILTLSTTLFALTNGGFYVSIDLGDNWLTVFSGEIFHTINFLPLNGSIVYVVFGENGYYSSDFITFNEFDMTNVIGGPVTSQVNNNTYMFIGTETGGVYRMRLDAITGIDDEIQLPQDFVLEQNYPNPFNPSTTIRFSLPETAEVQLEVVNIRGQVVAQLINERRGAGIHSVVFDATGLPSGIYFYRMTANSVSQVQKMVLMR